MNREAEARDLAKAAEEVVEAVRCHRSATLGEEDIAAIGMLTAKHPK
jgi:hypothetical protein